MHIFSTRRKNSELFLDLAVEEPLDRVRSKGVVALIGAVADECQRGMSISEVLDTKRDGHIVQQASPTPTVTFGCGRNRLFADHPLSFFVVAGFRRFRSDRSGRPEFIGDLPINCGPAADQMDVTGLKQTCISCGNSSVPVIHVVQLRIFIVQRKTSSE